MFQGEEKEELVGVIPTTTLDSVPSILPGFTFSRTLHNDDDGNKTSDKNNDDKTSDKNNDDKTSDKNNDNKTNKDNVDLEETTETEKETDELVDHILFADDVEEHDGDMSDNSDDDQEDHLDIIMPTASLARYVTCCYALCYVLCIGTLMLVLLLLSMILLLMLLFVSIMLVRCFFTDDQNEEDDDEQGSRAKQNSIKNINKNKLSRQNTKRGTRQKQMGTKVKAGASSVASTVRE